MSFDRSDITLGPGVVGYNSQTIHSEGDIVAAVNIERFQVPSVAHGRSDERVANITNEITFTPAGRWISAHLSLLWPHTSPVAGSSIFGATDKNLTVQGLDGRLMTFKAAAITGMPDIRLSAVQSMVGPATFTAIGANDTAWSDAARVAADSSQSYTADSSFAFSALPTVPYSAAWGSSSPWDAIETTEGWTISFELDLVPITVDSVGIVDMRLRSLVVMAKCTPANCTAAEYLSLLKVQGTGAQRGMSLSGNVEDLVIQGPAVGDPKVTLYNCAPVEAGFRWGDEVLRSNELGFVSVPYFTSGVPQALYALGTVPEA